MEAQGLALRISQAPMSPVTFCERIANLPHILALVGRRRRLRDASWLLHTASAGTFMSARHPTPAPCEISPCKPTAPKYCGWPAVWRRNVASRSARRCMTPLICAPLDRLETDIGQREPHGGGVAIVLGGFELGTDVHVVRYPGRYMDARGAVMWDRVTRLIANRRLTTQEAA